MRFQNARSTLVPYSTNQVLRLQQSWARRRSGLVLQPLASVVSAIQANQIMNSSQQLAPKQQLEPPSREWKWEEYRSSYIAPCWLGRWRCGGGVLQAVRVAVTPPAVVKALASRGTRTAAAQSHIYPRHRNGNFCSSSYLSCASLSGTL